MKISTILQSAALLLAAFPALLHAAPTEIARESFEGTPGSIGFTTSVPQFIETAFNPVSDFFSVIPNNGTKISGSRVLSGADGASIFAAEDCDTNRTLPATAGPQEVSLTTNAVNIAGKTNTQVRLLMAAPGRSDGVTVTPNEYENFTNAPLFINRLIVEASIDGGPFQRVVQFSPTVVGTPTTLSYDGDGNNIGSDANPIPSNPTVLDATLREGIYAIPTGNTVAIRVTFETDATGELICFDNIRIFGESPATSPPSIAGVPGSPLVFTEGGAAAAIAPALTITDSDSANLTSASVVINQALVPAEDVLAATPSGALAAGNITYTAATGTLAITGSAPLADYQAVLRSVTYRNSNLVSPATNLRRVAFSTTDGANSSNAPVRDISVVDNIATQPIPFVESWETEGRGTRYAVEGGFSNPPGMFHRYQPGSIAGLDGTFGWGAENVDDNPDLTDLITFRLDATGLANLTGELRVAAGGGAVYDGGSVPDFLRVEASADGGPFVNVLAFYAESGAQAVLRQDTTPADGTNLGDGTVLTAALQNFTFNLPSATTLTVRIRAHTNIIGEHILFDRLAVQGTPVTFAINSVSGAENAGAQSFTVTRNISAGTDTVTYTTTAGTAGAADFTSVTSTVSFADGETTKPISISITPDNVVELDETYSVTLSNPTRGTITGGPGIGTITNDDASVLSITGGSVAEGDSGTAAITFNLALTNPVDVAVSTTRNTQDGTATVANSDYAAQTAVATALPANTTAGSFTVTVNGDNTPEANETFQVVLSALSAGGRSVTFAGGGATLAATGTITDDDPALVAGSGSMGLKLGVSGKLTTASLLALATGGEGRPLSFVSVQAGPTAGGGTVSVAGGWVIYQPAPGFSGVDSFTYTITDSILTANGSVTVIADRGIGMTQNILTMTNEGPGKRVVALGIPGRTYRWQTSSNLATWTNLGAAVVCPASGVMTVLDPGPLPPTRFYRLAQ